MVLFKNAYYQTFLNENRDKRIILFGSGTNCHNFLNNTGNYKLNSRIDVVLDNNPKCEYITINRRKVLLIKPQDFIALGWDLSNYVIIIMVSNPYIMDIVNQLDEISEFDKLSCYYGPTALTWGKEAYPYPASQLLPQPLAPYSIPKTIHYCWFGKGNLPELAKRCINSWKKHCPDYEIKAWTEENYDLTDAPLYVKQAYKAKMYAFVSDYVRLDVVHKYGGVYLDVDVELFKNLDVFLYYKSVFGFESNNAIATGLGFASVALNPLLAEFKKLYEEISFVLEDGSYNLVPCPTYGNEFFRHCGVLINNTMQIIDDNLFLPSDYLGAIDHTIFDDGCRYYLLYVLTSNTISLHHYANSWLGDDFMEQFEGALRKYKEINSRLLRDWIQNIDYK